MGLLDTIRGKISGKESIPTAMPLPNQNLNLEKPLSFSLVKSLRGLDLDKPEILQNTVFLLDVSGSMSDRINGIEKIKSLRKVMADIQSPKMICFADTVVFCNYVNQIPEPHGSTDLSLAFKYILEEPKTKTAQKIIVVSDGEPNNQQSALSTAKHLNRPVDVIYIGSSGTDGELFMKKLVRETGGRQINIIDN